MGRPREENDWRRTVERLRAESNTILREVYSPRAPVDHGRRVAGDPATAEPPPPPGIKG